MRAFGLFSFTVVALVLGRSAEADSWKEYSYDEWGFAAQFPAPPILDRRPYHSVNGSVVTEHVFSANQGGVIYLVSVADFTKAGADGTKTIDEAAAALIAKGRLTIDYPGRINRDYGREIVVLDKDGTSYTDAIFFVGGKLYQIEVIYPVANSDPVGSSGIGFFQTAFRFLR